ncbi:DoxX family protein [Tamlana nanhaiensis]|uniref:DoxX family protein n=1 Tax=Neotamlana nanhaiensis TaxID=1382798 RepID=A0A0D7W624_9FLAO|nr:DoxX family membrane protein [Tamlana nanhaiensis]KJD34575.1 DoxX family protein [Tamlana nanhaiensis]
MNKKRFLIIRLIVAVILWQTLRFKFTAHPDSVYIFDKIGLEPYGRIGIGIIELISGLLILIPKTVKIGAIVTFLAMLGAVCTHLTILGIEIKNDGGILFVTAVITLILSLIILLISKQQKH